jgi:predicted molibdopterin-dependent oxidoreductase YjgC
MSDVDLRIRDDGARGPRVTFTWNGRTIAAYSGESVAAALWAAGVRGDGGNHDEGPPYRVLFCAMGVCQQCVVTIDGTRVEACRVGVRDGLDVRPAR